jgi:hypothetical protein
MKKMFTSAWLCCACTCAFAQEETKNFLYLYSDSVIYADHIYYESSPYGSPRFIVDSKQIHAEQVKFFNSNQGFFANVRDLTLRGTTSFSERIRKGKINLFERENVDFDRFYYTPYGTYATGGPAVSRSNFYNIGYGDLKRTNYANLKVDLADNPRSMMFLRQLNQTRQISTLLLGAGGATFLAGLVTLVKKGSGAGESDGFPSPGWSSNIKEPNFGPSFALLGITLLGSVGYLVSLKKTKQLKRAIDAYNY